jgi:chromosome segregation and condensation protein ScpB
MEEVLAIVAHRQGATAREISEIRGVNSAEEGSGKLRAGREQQAG